MSANTESYVTKTKKIINTLSSERNLICYHYTNYDGLYGIIKSNSIWLSDVCSFIDNDELEIQYGIEIIQNLLEKRASTFVKENNFEKSNILYVAAYTLMKIFYARNEKLQVYTSSFCDIPGDLAMWRYYADKGAGFVLGFKMGNFSNYSDTYSPEDTIALFNKVLYGQTEALQICDQLIDAYVENGLDCLERFLLDLYVIFPSFKRNSYSHEKERRLVSYISKHIAQPKEIEFIKVDKENPFKSSKTILPFKYNKDSLTEIYVGHKCNFRQAERDIKNILTDNNYTQTVKIEAIEFT